MSKGWMHGALACLLALPLPAAASCGAAFCTINTNWSVQGAWGEPGIRLDLRYEYVNLNQPRNGSRKVRPGEAPRHHDEVYTVNRNWVGALDATIDPEWGIAASVPWVDRRHFHIHNHRGAALHESWDFSGIGDARVAARRKVASYENREAQTLGMSGIDFGLKLPTGAIDERNGAGGLAERSLQPGSGTVDALVGAHTSHLLPMRGLGWFAQGMWQFPLAERSGYRPGRRLSLDAGLRYELGDRLAVMLQANALYRSRDRGANAEPADSGGRELQVGPGLSYQLTESLQAYGFLQLPVYQHVNGVQLTARRSAMVGVSARF